MRRSFWGKTVVLVSALLLSAVHGLCAAEVTQVVADLTPRSGFVILQNGNDYLIDLDTSKGIRVGDLVSVIHSGAEITHPVTKEIVGSLDVVAAVLRVTQVKTGYAHAARISGAGTVTKGDMVRSYSGIPASFWDYTGAGEKLYEELRNSLPELVWQPYAATQQSKPENKGPAGTDAVGVIFVLTTDGLEVRDSAFEPIGFYPSKTDSAVDMTGVARPSAPQTAAANAKIIKSSVASGDKALYGPDLPGLAVGVAVGDFNGDGRLEIASAFTARIVLSTYTKNEIKQTASLPISGSARLLSIDAVDLDNDGRDELYLTAVDKAPLDDSEHVASMYVEFVDGALQVRQSEIPYLLGSVRVPGEGRILIGQRPGGPGQTYSAPVFRLVKQGERLSAGEPYVDPTGKATVHGLVITTDQAGQRLFVQLAFNERLTVINAAGETLWEGVDVVGGTESYLVRTGDDSRKMDSVADYLKARLEVTTDGLILVPVNAGSTRMLTFREYSKSYLSAYSWDGRSLREMWKTAEQSGSLAGFALADVDSDGRDELVTIVIYNHGTFLNPALAKSTLVIYELP